MIVKLSTTVPTDVVSRWMVGVVATTVTTSASLPTCMVTSMRADWPIWSTRSVREGRKGAELKPIPSAKIAIIVALATGARAK